MNLGLNFEFDSVLQLVLFAAFDSYHSKSNF